MNEPAIRTEEQIISLFPDRETLICRGWVLKRMEGQLLVYPLYYKFSEGDIPENIRRCEEISRQCGAGCVFRIVEHTNYHLSSILTDNGYGLEKCGVVGECDLTRNAGEPCPAVCSGKWNCKDTGRYSGGGRNAGAVWAAGLLQGLSLPPLSEK